MAATNPTRSIRQYEHPSAFDVSAADLLKRLSDLAPATDVPYLTVTLDWRIMGDQPGRREDVELKRSQQRNVDASGGNLRPSLTQVDQELNRLIEQQGPRGDIRASLEKDRERILDWLKTELDPSAQGAYIVTNAEHGVFEATGLALPLKTRVRLAPTPQLYRLVRLIEDNPTYAVLVADQANAELSFITRGYRSQSIELTSSLYPRHQQQGAFNQRRYQNRANERVEAFARVICDEATKALRGVDVETLVLMGSDVMMTAIEHAMDDSLKALVAARIRTQTPVDEHVKIDLTLPVAAQAERDDEAAVVTHLADRLGEGAGGAIGTGDTLRALQNGQVEELVMLDTFRESGWADYAMHIFGVGNIPQTHPVGGDVANVHEVDLRHEMIRLALATGAHIDVIHSEDRDKKQTAAAAQLEKLGDVGAILRYSIRAKDAQSPDA